MKKRKVPKLGYYWLGGRSGWDNNSPKQSPKGYLIRPDNFGHDTIIRYEYDMNTNLIWHEKIIKTRQKKWHDTDKKMNTIRKYEYLKIIWIARKMYQFLKNIKTRIDTKKNTRHDTRKIRTRYENTNCQI